MRQLTCSRRCEGACAKSATACTETGWARRVPDAILCSVIALSSSSRSRAKPSALTAALLADRSEVHAVKSSSSRRHSATLASHTRTVPGEVKERLEAKKPGPSTANIPICATAFERSWRDSPPGSAHVATSNEPNQVSAFAPMSAAGPMALVLKRELASSARVRKRRGADWPRGSSVSCATAKLHTRTRSNAPSTVVRLPPRPLPPRRSEPTAASCSRVLAVIVSTACISGSDATMEPNSE
mmetsp:Transcript_15713/g.39514  ORF Transcript_15713/g.39514 Transcript_15713/m.39514 type:complete len:242 (-) Transcript_15713:336-1061(-)